MQRNIQAYLCMPLCSISSSLEIGLFRGVTFSFSTAGSLSFKQDVDENIVNGHGRFTKYGLITSLIHYIKNI